VKEDESVMCKSWESPRRQNSLGAITHLVSPLFVAINPGRLLLFGESLHSLSNRERGPMKGAWQGACSHAQQELIDFGPQLRLPKKLQHHLTRSRHILPTCVNNNNSKQKTCKVKPVDPSAPFSKSLSCNTVDNNDDAMFPIPQNVLRDQRGIHNSSDACNTRKWA